MSYTSGVAGTSQIPTSYPTSAGAPPAAAPAKSSPGMDPDSIKLQLEQKKQAGIQQLQQLHDAHQKEISDFANQNGSGAEAEKAMKDKEGSSSNAL